jgi:hypothetical protein
MKAPEDHNVMTITFRCLPRHEAILPRPVPAVNGLPSWLKSMPSTAVSALQGEIQTVKQCPPFIDAMAWGFLMPLATDIRIGQGVFTWDRHSFGRNFPKPPINIHENIQVVGTPFFDKEHHIIKFNNFWTIETPPGYSLLVTHPVNRYDLPFVTITGLVDADRYNECFINFPARWCNHQFNGVLPKGTPIAQCIPLKRDFLAAQFATIEDEAGLKLVQTTGAIAEAPGFYRRQFRASKHWR